MIRRAAILSLCIAVAACDAGSRDEPLLVVTDVESPDIAARLERFTAETSVAVELHVGDPAGIVEELAGADGAMPADVLIASDVALLSRAAEEGALRPLQGTARTVLPETLRDPEGAWSAFDAEPLVIVARGPIVIAVSLAMAYRDLAAPMFHGKLCLPAVSTPEARALLASLIDEFGVRDAETVVRLWVRNLAAAPFADTSALVDAVAEGRCSVAVMPRGDAPADLVVIEPHPPVLVIAGAGVARHAHHPDAAQALVDWLVAHAGLEGLDTERPVATAARSDADARLLAERTGYR